MQCGATQIFSGRVFEDSGISLMARILADDGLPAQQADFSTITYKVFDTADGTQTATGTLTVASVVFNALQTGDVWDIDSDGYNFRFDAPASLFPNPDKTYQVEVRFTPPTAQPFYVVFRVSTVAVYTS